MERFGIIGFPVSHSLSPRLFSAAYSGRFEYDLIEKADFSEAWKVFSAGPYRAINVTAPFKETTLVKIIDTSPELVPEYVRKIGACNIAVKKGNGFEAHNSDYLGIKRYLIENMPENVAVIGFGGAGKASYAAAVDLGIATKLFRHDGIGDGLEADLVIYTLPKMVPGAELIRCRRLFEANYRDPVLAGRKEYVSGLVWLRLQALEGYALMSGEKPDENSLQKVFDTLL